MICNKCGAQNSDGSKFCLKCGELLNVQPKQQAQPQPQPAQQPQQAQQQSGQGQPQQSQQTQQARQNPNGQQQQYNQQQYTQQPYGQPYIPQVPYRDPYDHTSEYDANEISNNKIFAMLPYLLGWIGVIVALLASGKKDDSKMGYIDFHVRQALKITVVNTLLGIITLLLCWTIIFAVVGGICMLIMFVIRIIGFFSVCSGNAKELPIVRSLGFLK